MSPTTPTSGEGWAVGTFNYPGTNFWPGYPTLNGYVNASTAPGGANLPGSTYGPNMNGFRDAYRLQGAQGLVTKTASDTTAQAGVPITYTIKAQAQNGAASPPPASFTVVDTLPAEMTYVTGSASPAPSSVVGQTITWTFTNVPANVFQTITYKAQTPANSAVAPGTSLVNTVQINVAGDQRPATTAGRQATATVVVANSSATTARKSVESNVLPFAGGASAWNLTVTSFDPVSNPFTDTIDILPNVADGRGTNIDGTYSITGVTAPAGATVYYSSAPIASLSDDPRTPSNGAPGTIAGNTVGWSTTAVAHPTAIRVIGPALAPGAAQTIRIAFSVPAGTSCGAPLPTDNKPGQKLVNSSNSIAGHTALPMLSSTTASIGTCAPEPIDFGDAPNGYGTLLAANGARHGLPGYDATAKTATLMIGSHVSAETDGQPDSNAALDSYDDGLAPTSLVLATGATTASAVVTVVNAKATPATLAGWIDFNKNGQFDAGERAQVTVPANTSTPTSFTLNWSGLTPIPSGFSSFARFRIASDATQVANPIGAATDGEVEDYAVPLRLEPAACDMAVNGSFETPSIQGDPANPEPGTAYVGPWAVWRTSVGTLDGWQVTAGTVDILRYFNNASDGAQSIDLWGTAPATFEQTFTGLVPGQVYGFSVDYSGLSAANSRAGVYLDLGGGPQLLKTLAPSVDGVSNGDGGLPGTPQYTVVWQTYSYNFVATGTQATIRFVNQAAPATLNTGLFIDNFKFRSNSPCLDFGDAPDSYGTLLASNGARHGVPGYNSAAKTAPLMLGSRISAEMEGQPDANAALDTFDDGLDPTSLVLTTGATTASAKISAINAKATPATIAGWIDFNKNGTFDAGERAQVTVPANTNTATPFTLSWSGIPAIPAGFSSLARFRIASDATQVANPTGAASDGEVEDYAVPIKQPVGCATPPSVFNTAINAAGTGVLAVGSRDRNWEVGLGTPTGGPTSVPSWIQAYVTGNAAPGAWANSPFGNADWTSYFSNANQGTSNVEEYHRYRFTLDGAVDPSTFALGIDFYADNSVWEVYVNGQAQSGQIAGLPQSPTNPYFYAGFVAANRAQLVLNRNWRTGPNEIVVQVRSAPGAVGFLGQVTSTSLCPVQVGIGKSANPTGALTPNGTVTYTVIATNTGNVAAPNTIVSDPLPNGIVSGTWTCAAASGAVCPNATGTMPLNQTIATFPGGGVVAYTITGQVAASPPASVTNTASAAPPPGGTCYPGNTPGPCTAAVSNPPVPVIAIAKTANATQAMPGASVIYTVHVKNVGAIAADGTTISDPIPAGLSGASWTCTASGGALCPNASGTGAISETAATFPAGGELVYTVTATVDANPPAAIANTATAVPPSGGICADGSAPPCDSTVILPAPPRVRVVKSANPTGTVTPGGTVTYTVVVTNEGNVAAPNTRVSDAFPDGIASATWTCAAASGAACPNASSAGTVTPPANLLDETIATFPAGASVTYTITATVGATPPAHVINTAMVSVPGGLCMPGNTPPPCTSTVDNALIGPQITIVKVPTALDGTPFAFTTTATAPNDAFTLSSGTVLTRTFNVDPGTVSIKEGGNAGWVLTNIVCNNSAGAATFTYTGATANPSNGFERGDDTANVTVNYGDQVTCTYTNAPTALPTLAKYFNTDPPSDPPPQRPVIPRSGTALLTFVLSNKAPSASAQNGLAFTDTLPSGLVLANGTTPPSALVGTNTCGGTVTAQAGTAAISLAGGSVAVGADCSFTVRVAAAP
jgi:uncharacterized repeat protein (TIGR01451 family)/fimbrial isopeptide formation D2 family protein